jgi:hypothetical protein
MKQMLTRIFSKESFEVHRDFFMGSAGCTKPGDYAALIMEIGSKCEGWNIPKQHGENTALKSIN